MNKLTLLTLILVYFVDNQEFKSEAEIRA